MDAKKTLEEIGEEGIARLIVAAGDEFSIFPPSFLPRIEAMLNVDYNGAWAILDELAKQRYLSHRFKEGVGHLYDRTFLSYELIKKYLGGKNGRREKT